MNCNAKTFEMCSNVKKTLTTKMSQDNINVAKVKLNFNLLCDLHTLRALSCLLPLLEAISVLITLPQGYFHL